ncbi:hypothetical protein NHQ30_011549 [Ciborinia camelliae]|nr:hypothetical protein NHQ30_011549 [Ciborinia camelliae]
MLRQVYDSPVSALLDSVINLSAVADPAHYRLIDCHQFIRHQRLCIYEYTGSITNVSYAAISYVWRGNELDPNQLDLGAFAVRGAEDGDQIGIDTIGHACTASVREGALYIWLDRLCIMQMSKADKVWQIARMYDIYLHCKVCLVLPGGLRQLVGPEDETSWIGRAWTLQEVMAPDHVLVLFRWKIGPGFWQGYKGSARGTVIEVVHNKSATVSLYEVIEACSYPETLQWTPINCTRPTSDDVSVNTTGGSEALSDMLTESLSRAMNAESPQKKALAIWQNAFWRASSRPVDMVLSIMGIFGVSLNPSAFNKDDRIGATIALAKAILQSGGKPTWLLMGFDLPPCPFLSSFPEFPKTDVTGTVELQNVDDEQQFDLTLWWVDDLPSGSMDDDRYLSISAKAAPVVCTGAVEERTFASRQNDNLGSHLCFVRVTARDGKSWNILRHNYSHSIYDGKVFVVFVGHAQDYPRAETSATNMGPCVLPRLSPLRAVILEKHAPGRYHKAGALTLGEAFEPFIQDEWQERDFTIGGPYLLPRESSFV